MGGSLEIVEMLLVAAKPAATVGPSGSSQQPQLQQPHAAMALLNGADIFGTTRWVGWLDVVGGGGGNRRSTHH